MYSLGTMVPPLQKLHTVVIMVNYVPMCGHPTTVPLHTASSNSMIRIIPKHRRRYCNHNDKEILLLLLVLLQKYEDLVLCQLLAAVTTTILISMLMMIRMIPLHHLYERYQRYRNGYISSGWDRSRSLVTQISIR